MNTDFSFLLLKIKFLCSSLTRMTWFKWVACRECSQKTEHQPWTLLMHLAPVYIAVWDGVDFTLNLNIACSSLSLLHVTGLPRRNGPMFLLSSQIIKTETASNINKPVGKQIKNSTYTGHHRCWECSLLLCIRAISIRRLHPCIVVPFQKRSIPEPLVSWARCVVDILGVSCFEICSLSEKESEHVWIFMEVPGMAS